MYYFDEQTGEHYTTLKKIILKLIKTEKRKFMDALLFI